MRFPTGVLALIIIVAAACGDPNDPAAVVPIAADDVARATVDLPAPDGLVTVALADGDFTFWPHINWAPQENAHDPVNLIFIGFADPRNIRSALMALGGARPAPFSAFDCTWTDAIGGLQVSWAGAVGWTGSVIQLECGAYDPFRFHIRLFPAGGRTLANAHVEILIPGTHQHQVLNWEVAEQFILFEFARASLLGAAPARTGPINAGPTFGVIPVEIYNFLPLELRALAGGPLGDVTEPVGMPNDGSATVIRVAAAVPPAPGTVQELTLQFGQFIPKPFCAAPGQLVRVDGPLTLAQTVTVSAAGDLASEMFANGDLTVRNITATGLGDPIAARVRDHNRTLLGDDDSYVAGNRHQRLIPDAGPVEQLQEQLRVGPNTLTRYRADELCR